MSNTSQVVVTYHLAGNYETVIQLWFVIQQNIESTNNR